MKAFLTVCFTLILTGCATLQQLSSYTVSNAELEQVLDDKLSKLHTRANLSGIPIDLAVEDITVNIGPEDRDVVQLGTLGTATINIFGFSYPVKLNLALEGKPYYDGDKKAIFVDSLALLNSSIDAGGYKGNLAPVNKELMKLLNNYLSNNPVYTLDQSNSAVRLLSSVPLDLTIDQGKLALHPKRQALQ